ncbi:MAG: helix-turn-helix domain-containing protein [Dehalococcoidia bacterium]
MPDTQTSLLTISQASRMLGVSEVTLRQWTDEGRIEAFITPGGHRRYPEAELRRFIGAGNRMQGIKDLVARMKLAPEQEQQIANTRFIEASWYKNLDAGSRARLGEMGRKVYLVVMAYITKPGKRSETLQHARDVGTDFGRYLVELGVPLTDCLEAFMLHRSPLINAGADLMKKRKALNERVAEAIPLVTQITDEVLLSLVAAYQDHGRNTGDEVK